MGYWPSYSTIAPACRAAYLQWLADGRHAPDAYIGYVFLYFYGLERRLLVDSQRSAAARAERETLVAEVGRLLRIYGTNGSFRGYAEGLLAFVTPDDAERRYLSAAADPAGRLGGAVRVAARARPASRRRQAGACGVGPGLAAPASRRAGCARQRRAARTNSDEVFTRRYRERFGDGLLLEPGGAMLQPAYQPGERRDLCSRSCRRPTGPGRRQPRGSAGAAPRS